MMGEGLKEPASLPGQATAILGAILSASLAAQELREGDLRKGLWRPLSREGGLLGRGDTTSNS